MMIKRVQISVNADGRGKVFVDGHDLSDAVQTIEFTSRAGREATVTLHLAPSVVDIEAEAEVIVRDGE